MFVVSMCYLCVSVSCFITVTFRLRAEFFIETLAMELSIACLVSTEFNREAVKICSVQMLLSKSSMTLPEKEKTQCLCFHFISHYIFIRDIFNIHLYLIR